MKALRFSSFGDVAAVLHIEELPAPDLARALYGVDTLALDVIVSSDVLEGLRPAFEQGLITPPGIERTCSLEEAVEAYREVDTGTAKGKIVIAFPHCSPAFGGMKGSSHIRVGQGA